MSLNAVHAPSALSELCSLRSRARELWFRQQLPHAAAQQISMTHDETNEANMIQYPGTAIDCNPLQHNCIVTAEMFGFRLCLRS